MHSCKVNLICFICILISKINVIKNCCESDNWGGFSILKNRKKWNTSTYIHFSWGLQCPCIFWLIRLLFKLHHFVNIVRSASKILWSLTEAKMQRQSNLSTRGNVMYISALQHTITGSDIQKQKPTLRFWKVIRFPVMHLLCTRFYSKGIPGVCQIPKCWHFQQRAKMQHTVHLRYLRPEVTFVERYRRRKSIYIESETLSSAK